MKSQCAHVLQKKEKQGEEMWVDGLRGGCTEKKL